MTAPSTTTVQRRLDLYSHQISGIVETTLVVLVGARNPTLADDGHERVAGTDTLGHKVDLIHPGLDIIDVEKNILAVEPLRNAIAYRSRCIRRILSPITNEDTARHVEVLAQKGH
jgi:hypothetical protein